MSIFTFSITFVSSSSKEGIRELQDRIHAAAIAARMVDTREFIVGMQVCVCACVYV